jgi:hypothetical protein
MNDIETKIVYFDVVTGTRATNPNNPWFPFLVKIFPVP